MITSEVALSWLTHLCETAQFPDIDFTIIPLANPHGRKKVEAGAFCWRSNSNGIDINRNWSFFHGLSS